MYALGGDQCNLTVYSYNTVHGAITVYKYDAIRIGTLVHAFWVRVSFHEVQSLVEAGCRDVQIAWPHECAVRALLKRTATITQTGVRSQTLRSGIVVFNYRVAPSKSPTSLHQ